jgi:hypothetical protein
LFDKKGVEIGLRILQATPLYDKKREQWNWCMNKEQQLIDSNRPSHLQLLGILAEAATGNIEGAKTMLEKLKATPLYDKKREQWNESMNKEQQLIDSNRLSYSHLLGILAENIK